MIEITVPIAFYHDNMQAMRTWAREALGLRWSNVYFRGYISGGRNHKENNVILGFEKEADRLAFKLAWGF